MLKKNTEYVKIVYMLCNDLNYFPDEISLVSTVHDLLGELGLMQV